jgi:hypothetical protein
MHHGPVPAFPVGRQMPDHPFEQGAAQALVLVDGTQFRPFLFRLMLNFIALGGNALVQNLPGGPCRKIASKAIEIPPASTSPSTTSSSRVGATSLTAMMNTRVVTRPTLSSKDDLAEPITPMWMLFFDLLHENQVSFSSC